MEAQTEIALSWNLLGQQLPTSITPFSVCTLFWSVHEPQGGNGRVNGFGKGGVAGAIDAMLLSST